MASLFLKTTVSWQRRNPAVDTVGALCVSCYVQGLQSQIFHPFPICWYGVTEQVSNIVGFFLLFLMFFLQSLQYVSFVIVHEDINKVPAK